MVADDACEQGSQTYADKGHEGQVDGADLRPQARLRQGLDLDQGDDRGEPPPMVNAARPAAAAGRIRAAASTRTPASARAMPAASGGPAPSRRPKAEPSVQPPPR